MSQQYEADYPASDEDFGLWRLLDHTRYVISRSREIELAQYGLTPEQAYVLDILTVRGGSASINDIVEKTLRQHHTISTLITRMVKHGLVMKKRSLNDKRKYSIIITEKGQKLFKKVTRDSIRMAFSPLSEKDKRELNSHLRQLLARAYELVGKEIEFTAESTISRID